MEDAKRLRGLLDGTLEHDEQAELETALEHRPALRRALADLALQTDRTRPDPSVMLKADIRTTPTKDVGAGVDVGPTLGRGGMALVRLGQQLKLDRPVAVKTLRVERQNDRDIGRLLREARITGKLEHPNIVPVHDIVQGADGVPQVVLKLIEGETWSALMSDPDRVRQRFGADDLLEWNLSVIVAVSRALSFAHSRGVLHRDVKPSNVMVGPFGEVYLLDWGIALELDEVKRDEAERSDELAGTSAYMAPEQLEGDDRLLGPWTDTYLLGATMFHMLTGRPPHHKRTLEERVGELLEGAPAPAVPEHVPVELRRLVAATLAVEPSQRTQTPAEVREAIEAYLRHRAANRLADRGDREAALAEDAREESGAAEVERHAQAADVAYRAALDEWAECPQARAGVERVAALRVEHALARGEPHVAARLVEASDVELPAALRERVGRAMEAASANEARLRQIVTDADRGLGHRARGLLGGVFGLAWVVFWSAMAFWPPETVTPLLVFNGAFVLAGVVFAKRFAADIFKNRINRTSAAVVISGAVVGMVWILGAGLRGLDMPSLFGGWLLVMGLAGASMATLMDPWGTVSAAGYCLAFLAASYEPRWTPWAVLGGNVVLILNQLILNWARGKLGFVRPPSVRPGTSAATDGRRER